MSSITFHGAAGTVTGSRFLLDLRGKKYLIDCGMFQGTKENRLMNWDRFPIDPALIDDVFISHAHIDHTGYLPRLTKDGFDGRIHSTKATSDLCQILLRDSARLQEEDADFANEKGFSKHSPALPLYTVDDAEKALGRFSPHHVGEHVDLGGGARLKFKDAGHILGSAFIDIRIKNDGRTRKILFSGDYGRPDQPILRDPSQVYDVDYLVLESTYGNRLHDNKPTEEELARVINESLDRGGILIIPSFAVGRTQSLLYIIRELEEKGLIPSVPVYVDSPMSIRATDVFERHIMNMDLTARMLTLSGVKIFQTRQLSFTMSRRDSMGINSLRGNAIVISSSGMVTGGRVLHHMTQRLPHEENTVLFIGYQAEGTRGRSILEGAESVKIHGEDILVRAKVESISGFSGHGDYNEILAWLMGFNRPPEKTFIVHGEPEARESMAEKIRRQFGWEVIVPALGDEAELDM